MSKNKKNLFEKACLMHDDVLTKGGREAMEKHYGIPEDDKTLQSKKKSPKKSSSAGDGTVEVYELDARGNKKKGTAKTVSEERLPIGFKTPSELDLLPSKRYGKCADTHPPLPIVVNGTTYHIYGGSCLDPVVLDMDVFVGFDIGMQRTSRQYPWCDGEEFMFPIVDMSTPKDLKQAQSLLDYLEEMLLDGKKVFIGCIGGHGRTGVILSALVKQMTGEEDAITYVRNNYCKRVVESRSQINWLNKHFGIKKVEGSKENLSFGQNYYKGTFWKKKSSTKSGYEATKKAAPKGELYGYLPEAPGSIHGDNAIKNKH